MIVVSSYHMTGPLCALAMKSGKGHVRLTDARKTSRQL